MRTSAPSGEFEHNALFPRHLRRRLGKSASRKRCASAHLVDGVAPVLRKRTHLFRPAALLALHPPFGAHQHIGAVNLVDGGIARRLVLLGNGLTADLMPERLALHAGHRAHTRHLLQKGYMLDVIDFVEERFLGWI